MGIFIVSMANCYSHKRRGVTSIELTVALRSAKWVEESKLWREAFSEMEMFFCNTFLVWIRNLKNCNPGNFVLNGSGLWYVVVISFCSLMNWSTIASGNIFSNYVSVLK